MAQITINFPNMPQARLNKALADYGNYQPKLDDGSDNPVTRATYAESVLKGIARDIVRQHEKNLAVAQAAALPDPDAT